jgi:hypothetical protein
MRNDVWRGSFSTSKNQTWRPEETPELEEPTSTPLFDEKCAVPSMGVSPPASLCACCGPRKERSRDPMCFVSDGGMFCPDFPAQDYPLVN